MNRSSSVSAIGRGVARGPTIRYPDGPMANVQLPVPGRPYVLIEPASERRITDLDSSPIVDLYKAHGAVLFRGFQAAVAEFGHFARSLCPTNVANQSAGRTTIDAQSNVRTVDPGVGAFALHSELSREPWTPDVALFACLSAPARGGATTICDGVELVRQMPEEIRRGLTGRRLLHLKPTWPELLQFWLGTPDPTDEMLANPPSWCPYGFRRLGGDVIRYFSRPALHRPMFSDQPAFANFLLFSRFTRHRGDYPLLDDETRVPEPWLQGIKATADRLTAEVAWRPGDVLMLDNTRFMHGRTAILEPRERLIASFFGYLSFAIPDAEEPPNALWRQANFRPPLAPHERGF
nr:TauD/TfdA family dioxygenase [Sphingomonas sp.]